MERIYNWTARRAGGRITVNSFSNDGTPRKVPNVDTITPNIVSTIATDKNGVTYSLMPTSVVPVYAGGPADPRQELIDDLVKHIAREDAERLVSYVEGLSDDARREFFALADRARKED